MNHIHTHTLAEWLAMVSLAVSGAASFSVPYFVFVDADLADFDPRPAVRRIGAVAASASCAVRCVAWDVSRSEAVHLLLREWDNARHAFREAARDAAALLLLLTTRPKGALS